MSIRLALQGQMEYPSFLIGWILSNIMQFGVGLATLKVITNVFQAINGWSFPEIAFLYGLGILSHGLSVVLFIQTWNVENYIIYGGIDRMMLRPLNVFFQFLTDYINLIGLTDLFPGVLIFIYAAASVHYSITFVSIINLILIIIGATLIRGGIYAILGNIAFWTKSSRALISMAITIMDKSIMYPMSIYGRMLQAVFTFIIPFGFIAFMPASQILGKSSGVSLPGNIAIWTFGIGVLLFSLGALIFKKGLTIYESAGN